MHPLKKSLLFICIPFMMNSCQTDTKSKGENPFFSDFETVYGVFPFDKIRNEHYIPAFEAGFKQHSGDIAAIVANKETPTFENTIVAFDNSGKLLDRVASVFFAMENASANEDIQKISEEMTPKVAEHNDNIFLNEKLFERVKSVYDDSAANPAKLNTEQKRLLDKFYKRFVRSGIMLGNAEKTRLREINKELSSLCLRFNQNLLTETNDYQLIIDTKEELAGLPEDVVSASADLAKAKGVEGKWLFTLQKPSWLPFLQYAENRELREKLYKAMYNRGNNDNESDNKKIINTIVNLRLEKANLLGYKTHADFVLAENMAKTPEKVSELLLKIWDPALNQAKREVAELQQLVKEEGGDFKLQSWDWWFYAEKLRQKKYSLNEEELKPYFQLENVRDGVFAVTNKLFGLSFELQDAIPLYHPESSVFKVTDAQGAYVGMIYLDYFPRDEKRVGAWMGNFSEQFKENGTDRRPVVYNVGNFTRPTGDKPSLLTTDEVETLFHEFGHALHGLLADCNYAGVSGTNVALDFVELPSQILEHWAFHPDVLKIYAKHYQTGEIIPDALVQKIQNAAYFNQGFATTELVAAALLDLSWHTVTEPKTFDVAAFEHEAMAQIQLIEEIIPRYRTTYFSHIFSDPIGYSSGYYSYLWSEVLDADAFELFSERGIFDQETARSFRENVLSKGDSEEPMVLYKRFRGTEPDPKYLLKNRGL